MQEIFTVEKKLKVYESVLKMLRDYPIESDFECFVCVHTKDAANRLGYVTSFTWSYDDDQFKQSFPELFKRKPQDLTDDEYADNEGGWFPLNECGYMMRVMLIDECIKELKQIIK